MVLYKIKHIPTGFYYTPVKGISGSNLSKNGKIYSQEPKLGNYGHEIKLPSYSPNSGILKKIREVLGEKAIISYPYTNQLYLKTTIKDWIIEKLELKL